MNNEFRDFVKNVIRILSIQENQIKMTIGLFKAIGAKKDISETAVVEWLKGRLPNLDKYFPDAQYDTTGFIRFFKRWKKVPFEKQKEAFHQVYPDGFINYETSDPEIFYRSLLYEFLAIVNLPLPDDYIEKNPNEDNDITNYINNIMPDKMRKTLSELYIRMGRKIDENPKRYLK